ncbi:MAG: pyroglutamyl-peptidase I [Candidatus Thermoplasmatota archaeon]|nr:pyroglutamyl-peptidase I [Candidatus Thermoplasmatota archaeon]MBS3789935.1 pyroglutamyl-peptidase I [Candidatus Thermoplasmatota archaeon]
MQGKSRSSGKIDKLLITGFDAFGGESVNPASEVVLELDGLEINDCRIIAREIPTIYGKSPKKVKAMIDEVDPDGVLHIGQASGTHGIRVERIALNINDARIEDNEGNQPKDETIVKDGPLAYRITLPTKEIVEAVKDDGIPAFLSYSAGTFVCNHVIYNTAHHVNKNDLPIDYGFIHVPYLPEQAVDKNSNPPSMSKETIKRALITTIKTITKDR